MILILLLFNFLWLILFQLSDPGFDWSNTGFRPEDLAAVGKLGTDEMAEDTDKPAAGDEHKKTAEVKKEKAKDAKFMSRFYLFFIWVCILGHQYYKVQLI